MRFYHKGVALDDKSTASNAGLKSGDALLANEELQLVLEREGYADMPFSCLASEDFASLKERLEVPKVCPPLTSDLSALAADPRLLS